MADIDSSSSVIEQEKFADFFVQQFFGIRNEVSNVRRRASLFRITVVRGAVEIGLLKDGNNTAINSPIRLGKSQQWEVKPRFSSRRGEVGEGGGEEGGVSVTGDGRYMRGRGREEGRLRGIV